MLSFTATLERMIMDAERQKLVDDYKNKDKALRTRERLDKAKSLGLGTLVLVGIVSWLGSIVIILTVLWQMGLGVVSILLIVGLAYAAIWTVLDARNKKDLEGTDE